MTVPELLYVETDVEHVALADDVVTALDAEQAPRLGLVPAARIDQVLVPDDLRPDEPALEVGVDDAGGLRGGGAPADLPGPGLVLAGGQERDEVERAVARRDHP